MKAIGALIVFFALFVMAYLVGAFICWDFNAGNWDIFPRLMVGIIGSFVGGIAASEALA